MSEGARSEATNGRLLVISYSGGMYVRGAKRRVEGRLLCKKAVHCSCRRFDLAFMLYLLSLRSSLRYSDGRYSAVASLHPLLSLFLVASLFHIRFAHCRVTLCSGH